MSTTIKIEERLVGPGNPTFIIAEMSANHNHDIENAIKIIEAANSSGADAIKLQTYTPDTLTIASDKPYFKVTGGTPWDGLSLYELYDKAYTPWEWHAQLKAVADDLGLIFFSTPFDFTAVDFLEELDVPCWKVASFELVDIPLIERIAATGKPMILSTGMASLAEIDEAITAIRKVGNVDVALLKCTSAYPAPPESMNLKTIPHLSQAFQVPVGLSDHTLGVAVPIAAVSQSACIIEKHITLSAGNSSPDSAFSLDPAAFREMVDAVRTAEKAIGEVSYETSNVEKKSNIFRRSLFFVENLRKGDTINPENLRSIRPGYGLAPKYYYDLLGRQVAKDIERGTPASWDLIMGLVPDDVAFR